MRPAKALVSPPLPQSTHAIEYSCALFVTMIHGNGDGRCADLDVLALSPRALLEPGRLFECEVCGKRFHRVYNMYKHRRLHGASSRKPLGPKKVAVFVCPEPRCRHHHPAHAMANFTAIKKHFQHKHCADQRLWTCARCATAFAARAEYKRHLKTCGAQAARIAEHHQDTCHVSPPRSDKCLSPATGDSVGLGVTAYEAAAAAASGASGDLWMGAATAATNGAASAFQPLEFTPLPPPDRPVAAHDVELQFIPPRRSCAHGAAPPSTPVWCRAPPAAVPVPHLELSLWFGGGDSQRSQASASAAEATATRLKEEAWEQRRLAAAERAATRAARAVAQLARHELAVARRVGEQAQEEFSSAHALRCYQAARQVDATPPQATSCGCRSKLSARAPTMSSEAANYAVSVLAEVDVNGRHLN